MNFVAVGLDLADGIRPARTIVPREGTVYSPGALPMLFRRGRVRDVLSWSTARAAVCALSDPALTLDLSLRQ